MKENMKENMLMMVQMRWQHAVVCTGVVFLCGCKEEAPSGVATPPPPGDDVITLSKEAARLARVELAAVGSAALTPQLEFQGDVKLTAEQMAKVVARVNGVVRRISKQEGDKVRRGEGLAVVESRELGQAALSFLDARRQVTFTREALQREEQLLEKKITSKEAFLKRKREQEEAVHALEAAQQRLKMLGLSERQLSHGGAKGSRTTLVAPMAGTVIKRRATLGQAVSEGSELFELADLSRLTVEFRVPAIHLSALSKGQKVRIITKLNLEGEGEITWIAPVVDPSTRTVIVRATVDNKDGRWRPGICAKVMVTSARVKVDLAIPLDALQEVGEQQVVFVQRGPGQFKMQRVKTGQRDLRFIEVLEGLKVGQQVAAQNSLSLKAAWEQQGSE